MHRFFLLLAAAFTLASCSLSASDDALDYAFVPLRSSYASGDTLAATFVNRSKQTMYLKRCPPAGLVRVADTVWQGVRLDFICYQLRVVWTPVILEPGERYEVRLGGRVMEKANVPPNRYRLTLRIGSSEEEQIQTAVSEPFTIEP